MNGEVIWTLCIGFSTHRHTHHDISVTADWFCHYQSRSILTISTQTTEEHCSMSLYQPVVQNSKKVLPEPYPSWPTDTGLQFSSLSLHCKTTNMLLVHQLVCLFTSQPLSAKLYYLVTEAHRCKQLVTIIVTIQQCPLLWLGVEPVTY